MSNQRRIVIPWSGGLDSTYLMYKASLIPNVTVEPVYVDMVNQPGRERMMLARENILPLLEAQCAKGTTIERPKSTLSIEFHDSTNFMQPYTWLLAMKGYLGNTTEITTEVWFGYICGDQAISIIPDLQRMWSSMHTLGSDVNIKSLIKIKYPLVKVLKGELWIELPAEIKHHVTFCESSQSEDFCGYCDSCRTMAEMLKIGTHEAFHLAYAREFCAISRYRNAILGRGKAKPDSELGTLDEPKKTEHLKEQSDGLKADISEMRKKHD